MGLVETIALILITIFSSQLSIVSADTQTIYLSLTQITLKDQITIEGSSVVIAPSPYWNRYLYFNGTFDNGRFKLPSGKYFVVSSDGVLGVGDTGSAPFNIIEGELHYQDEGFIACPIVSTDTYSLIATSVVNQCDQDGWFYPDLSAFDGQGNVIYTYPRDTQYSSAIDTSSVASSEPLDRSSSGTVSSSISETSSLSTSGSVSAAQTFSTSSTPSSKSSHSDVSSSTSSSKSSHNGVSSSSTGSSHKQTHSGKITSSFVRGDKSSSSSSSVTPTSSPISSQSSSSITDSSTSSSSSSITSSSSSQSGNNSSQVRPPLIILIIFNLFLF